MLRDLSSSISTSRGHQKINVALFFSLSTLHSLDSMQALDSSLATLAR